MSVSTLCVWQLTHTCPLLYIFGEHMKLKSFNVRWSGCLNCHISQLLSIPQMKNSWVTSIYSWIKIILNSCHDNCFCSIYMGIYKRNNIKNVYCNVSTSPKNVKKKRQSWSHAYLYYVIYIFREPCNEHKFTFEL